MNTDSPAAPTATWRKSSYSTATGNCVEVAPAADGVVVRHSKHPTAGTITFSHDAWAAFIRDATEDRSTSTNGVATITKIGADTLVKSLATDVALRFDDGEWSAFLSGAADGEFGFTDGLASVRWRACCISDLFASAGVTPELRQALPGARGGRSVRGVNS
ncbi:DUF397 domain-containing protein [Amycolatopsis rhizosphaerae]|nr:DUF397 domain-containing protein [Amycolatopsis rhizosphaerae]